MDFAYTPEQEQFRAEVRALLSRALPPGWGTPDRTPPCTTDAIALDRV